MTDFNKIPEEIKIRNNWVCVRNGSKCPYMATAANTTASSTDRRTWSDFGSAQFAVEHGFYDGIGYCFDDTDIIGIDIDDGFDSDGFITEKAANIIDRMHSYTEVSRSGRGFHIYVKGQLPFPGRNNQKETEVYRTGRYFIVTGKMMFYPSIIENQKAIDWMVETFFPEMVHQAGEYNRVRAKAMYSPCFKKPEGKKIFVSPEYPEIPKGCRNVSMLSLGGALIRSGITDELFESEMRKVNSLRCHPPLSEGELRTIIRQCRKYK